MGIADGLAYAHMASIVHRDVKPANVRILEDSSVKVMDFGIAKSLQTESNLTQTGITLGTSAYLAPEQIRGESIDRRTDIFAMGVLSYELITYKKPFRGEHLSTVLYKILNDTPEPIESLALDAPPALVAAINRALSKTPDERYPTMDAFRKDLQAVFRELSGTSGIYPNAQALAETARTTHPEEDDLETTLATPSSGVSPINITPPSGALARKPAPSEATPTSAQLAAQARAQLELVNFRDPLAEETAVEEPAARFRRTSEAVVGVRRTRLLIFGSLFGALVVAAAVYFVVHRPVRVAPAPKPLPPPAAAAVTPALEFPEPALAHGEKPAPPAAPATLPTAAAPQAAAISEAPQAAAPPVAAPPAPEKPAAPAKKLKVQFSSVPVATLSVDGKEIGPSLPARTLTLSEGEHTVRFEAKGFPVYEKSIRVSSQSENRIHYQFPASMLVIEAPAWAGARLLVDGKYRGTLPETSRLKLPPGSYNLTLSREGVSPVTEKVTVPSGEEKVWRPAMPSPVAPGGAP
jgi:eukaryotic-like serine/threonine-protein kinase